MKKLLFVCVTLASLTIFSCGKDSTDTQATLDLRLTDGPGGFEAVLIDVIGGIDKSKRCNAGKNNRDGSATTALANLGAARNKACWRRRNSHCCASGNTSGTPVGIQRA